MIIVTGGAGFIGCNIIKQLNKFRKKNILVVDDLKDGTKYVNLAKLHIFDYLDKNYFIKRVLDNSINSYLQDIDVIFHEGACSSTVEWNGSYMMYNNYQYSKDLLHYCIRYNIPFIYASSAAVYGKDMSVSIDTAQCKYPVSVYGYSKFLFDTYVNSILKNVKSQVCGLRYFNVYGPHESHKGEMASVIFRWYEQIIDNQYPTLFFGSKYFKRDFIYIDDIVDINVWMWNNRTSGIFDCGTGVACSFEYIASILLGYLNKNIFKYISMSNELYKHYQVFTQANINQLRNIGYKKSYISVQDGIFKYLIWLKNNK